MPHWWLKKVWLFKKHIVLFENIKIIGKPKVFLKCNIYVKARDRNKLHYYRKTLLIKKRLCMWQILLLMNSMCD